MAKGGATNQLLQQHPSFAKLKHVLRAGYVTKLFCFMVPQCNSKSYRQWLLYCQ